MNATKPAPEPPRASRIEVDGIVAVRDKKPYVRLHADGKIIAQLSMAEARDVALNLLQQCSRGEADAMIWRFFDKSDFPPEAAAALMVDFREFRLRLDCEPVGRTVRDPDGPKPEVQ